MVSRIAARNLSYATATRIPGKTQNFIDGKFEDSKTDKWIDVMNPANNEVVTRVPQSTPEEMERAMTAAKSAFKDWSKTSPLFRQQVQNAVLLHFRFMLPPSHSVIPAGGRHFKLDSVDLNCNITR